jgi:Zn-dependent protease with chaperone function
MFGFYLLSLFVGLTLLVVAFFSMAVLAWPIAMLTLVGGVATLWSILPRPDRFVAPGPRLDPKSQPQLFGLINEVATLVGERAPREVYVIPEINAWVTQRGGILGFGSRRIMGIGLPLLSVLTVPQFRAVLAHEFGHFYAGDTRLAPFIYRTYSAIGRMVSSMEASDSAWLYLLFEPYAELFLRITRDVSRRQESVADELAARVAGRQAQIASLEKSFAANDAYYAYWLNVIMPLLDADVCPPILEGFSRFADSQTISGALTRNADKAKSEGTTDLYDSHPSLSERIEGVKRLPISDVPSNNHRDSLALTLLSDVTTLERDILIKFMTADVQWQYGEDMVTDKEAKRIGKAKASALRYVTWEDCTGQAYLPIWREMVRTYSGGLDGVTPDALPGLVKNLSVFGMSMLKKSGQQGQFDVNGGMLQLTSRVLGAALAVALHAAGWELHTSPGQPVYAQRDEQRIMPFEVLSKLMTGRLSAETWQQQCVEAGISGVDLGALAATDQVENRAGT